MPAVVSFVIQFVESTGEDGASPPYRVIRYSGQLVKPTSHRAGAVKRKGRELRHSESLAVGVFRQLAARDGGIVALELLLEQPGIELVHLHRLPRVADAAVRIDVFDIGDGAGGVDVVAPVTAVVRRGDGLDGVLIIGFLGPDLFQLEVADLVVDRDDHFRIARHSAQVTAVFGEVLPLEVATGALDGGGEVDSRALVWTVVNQLEGTARTDPTPHLRALAVLLVTNRLEGAVGQLTPLEAQHLVLQLALQLAVRVVVKLAHAATGLVVHDLLREHALGEAVPLVSAVGVLDFPADQLLVLVERLGTSRLALLGRFVDHRVAERDIIGSHRRRRKTGHHQHRGDGAENSFHVSLWNLGVTRQPEPLLKEMNTVPHQTVLLSQSKIGKAHLNFGSACVFGVDSDS